MCIRDRTNGVTPRRWIASCNPALTEVLDEYCPYFITSMESLTDLESSIHDKGLLEKIGEAKVIGKHNLATYIFNTLGISVDPSSMFDVQVKRIHEYKSCLLYTSPSPRDQRGSRMPSSA